MKSLVHAALAAAALTLSSLLLPSCASTADSEANNEPHLVIADNYEGARQAAIAEGRPLLINSTGHTAVNARLMETSIFKKPEVAAALDLFVESRLHSDAQDPEARSANQEVISSIVRETAVPVYVALNPSTGEELGRWEGATVEPAKFAEFLDDAAKAYR